MKPKYLSDAGWLIITETAYHRNGIAGEGFNVILFNWREGRTIHKMVATVFPTEGQCAVLDVAETAIGNIKYRDGDHCNRWRGDQFEGALRRFLRDYEAAYSIQWALQSAA